MQALKLPFTVAFDDADGEGIVFFGNYFRLAHRALEQWLPKIGIPWEEWFANPQFGAPLRHAEADYQRPLRPGQKLEIEIRVEELGQTSVHFEYTFQVEDQTIARLKTSHVFLSRVTKQKMDMPGDLRQRLERCL